MLPTPDCQRPEVLGHPVCLDLLLEEVEQVAGDGAGVVVQRLEGGVAVGVVGLDDGDDLARVDLEGLLADDVTGMVDRDGLAPRLDLHAVVDVVHAVEVLGLPRVDLDDDLVGLVQVGTVRAHRR